MAVRITVAEYDAARKDAVKAYVEGVSVATLATGEKNEADRKSAEYFVDLGIAWTNAPPTVLKDVERLREDIEFDFEAAKDGAEHRVIALHAEQTAAAAEGVGRAPSLSLNDAKKNSTKGIRMRRSVLENTVECIKLDPALARDSYAKAKIKGADGLNWTELCNILSNPLRTRAAQSTMKVSVGIAEDGRRRLMGEDYASTHVVLIRLVDGKEEEFTTTTFGPKGKTEDVEVIIRLVPSGELFSAAQEDIELRQGLQAADNAIIRKLLGEAKDPEFSIREARPKVTDR